MSEQGATAGATSSRVLRAATIVMVAFVASRALGLVREAVIGARFAILPEYGAYIAAFRIPDLIFNLVAGGALASAFLPTFSTFLSRDAEEEGWRLASAIANWLLIVLGLVALLAALFAPWILSTVIVRGFSPELIALTTELMRIMLLSTVIFSLSGLLMSILNAHEHFLLPAIAPIFYNLGILFGAIVLAPVMGIHGLAVGVVLGATGHLLVQLPMLPRLGARYIRTLGRGRAVVRESVAQVVRLMGPRVLGAAVVQLMFLSNTAIASYYGAPVVAALNYAWILMLLPHGIFAFSVATAIFPTFSRMVALDDEPGMRRTLLGTLRALLFVIAPAAVGLFVLRVPIIRLLFERGEFTPETTTAVAWALGFYSFGLVAHSLIEIANRAYFALKDTLTPVLVGGVAMIANIGLSLALIPIVSEPTTLARGPQGALALANSIASIGEVLVLLWLLRTRVGGLPLAALARDALRIGVAAALMGVALVALGAWAPVARLPLLLSLPLRVATGGALYYLVALAVGIDEARSLPARFRR